MKKGDKVLYYGNVYKVAYVGREYIDLKIPRRKYVMTVEKKIRYAIMNRELESLLSELKNVQNMSDYEVCSLYNVDNKDEALELIREAINDAEFEYTLQEEREIEENEMLETYNLICYTQGLSRYC